MDAPGSRLSLTLDSFRGVRNMSTVLDTTWTQAFAERVLGSVNGGFLSLMLLSASTASWLRAARPHSKPDSVFLKEAGFTFVEVARVEGRSAERRLTLQAVNQSTVRVRRLTEAITAALM
jgi:hypothetical protein